MKRNPFCITPKNAPWFFMAPGMLLFTIFGAYPILMSFLYSFQNKQGSKPVSFVWFANYARALGDIVFSKSLYNILVIFVMHAPLMIFTALLLAHILNQKDTMFRNAFRSAYFLPNVTNAVAYTMLFKIILSNDGVLNNILESAGLPPVLLMSDPFLAKWVISIMIMWRWTGYNMVIFLAAMQNISSELYEAAAIDGATKTQQYFNITIPMMKNPIIFTTIMTVSGTLNTFAESQLLTGNGGPNFGTYTPSLLIYNTAWKQFNFGYASALSYLISIITIVVAFVQFRIGRERD